MTTGEMIAELRTSLGNRTDIDDTRLALWLNWAQYDVCGKHRQRVANSRLFNALRKSIPFSTAILEGTCNGAATAATYINIAAAQSSTTADYYQDWIVKITGYDTDGAGVDEAPDGLLNQARVCVGSATYILSLNEAWDVEPDAYTEYTLYKQMYALDGTDIPVEPMEEIWAIQQIERLSDGAILEMKQWQEIMSGSFPQIGTPGAFARYGQSIIFDIVPESEGTYRLWYYSYPEALSADNLDGTSELPVYWHELLVLGAVYRGFQKLMEPDRAAEAYEQYNREVVNRLDDDELENAFISTGLRVRRE
jgi:hypothetical protein